jgi:hypothetical protein
MTFKGEVTSFTTGKKYTPFEEAVLRTLLHELDSLRLFWKGYKTGFDSLYRSLRRTVKGDICQGCLNVLKAFRVYEWGVPNTFGLIVYSVHDSSPLAEKFPNGDDYKLLINIEEV